MSSTSAVITVADLGERAIVERITRRLQRPSWVVVGPGDDAAVIESVPRTLEVLTTDALVEGVHFDRRLVPPDSIGYRALAVNLSDLAAMGARPRAALLSLVLPSALDVSDLDQMIGGMVALADDQRIAIVGGNVTRSTGPLIVDVTVTGSVKRRRVLTRSGARVGDEVYVTGTIGDATVGLASLRGTRASAARPIHAEARYMRPAPRGRAGVLLGEQKVATACIDLSDGLADGVRRIADASGAGITLDENALPFSQEVSDWFSGNREAMLEAGLSGGDDYELVFTCSPRSRRRLRGVQRLFGDLPITRIGMVTRDRAVCLRTSAGNRPLPDGFAHFA